MKVLSEETLDLKQLEKVVGPVIYERGITYYHQGRVQVDVVDEEYASATVNGRGGVYDVRIELDRNRLYFYCDCPYAADGKICKHCVATVAAVRDHLRRSRKVRWQDQLGKLLHTMQDAAQPSASSYAVLFSLQNTSNNPTHPQWKLVPYQLNLNALPTEIRVRLESGMALTQMISSMENLGRMVKAPFSALDPQGCALQTMQEVTLANLLISQARAYYQVTTSLTDYLYLLAETPALVYLGDAVDPTIKRLQILPRAGRLQIDLSRVQEDVRLSSHVVVGERVTPILPERIQVISTAPLWLLIDDKLVEIEGPRAYNLFSNFLNSPELIIPEDGETEFLEKFYLPLAAEADVRGDAVAWEEVDVEPVSRLYLSDAPGPGQGSLQIELRFAYGSYEAPLDTFFPMDDLRRLPGGWTLARLHRKPNLEQQAYQQLSSNEFGLKRANPPAAPGVFILRSKIHPLDFLMRYVPRLTKAGFEIYGEEKLKFGRVNRARPSVTLSVTSGIDWFDVKTVVSFGEIEVSLKEIRRALRRKERFIKLADGTVGEIPDEFLERYKHLFTLGQETADGLRLSNHHLTMLDQLLGETDQADEEFHRRVRKLRDFSSVIPQPLPQGLVGELRPYQKAGFDWLHFLNEFGFGGCLADDMGLGKTIQVLTFLLSLKERGMATSPSLIVLPRSLLVNWQRETARFTPSLRVLEYHGNVRGRDPALFEQYDLVVTTYGVMLRDIDTLRKFVFNYVILDESQAIKNPLAQTAKAARLLRSQHRLVMTGTPVENSSYELWSQFAFLNPGLLGNLEYFRSEFGTPIEKHSDEERAAFLRKMVYPFILRRTKDQVAPELPPRSERVVYSDMEPSQRKMYNRTRDFYRGVLLGMMEEESSNGGARMKVLEGLLRLRQICNHPVLVEKDFKGESAKFELIIETLETLRAEGHKALVFSQFVEMLHLVRAALDERQIPYAYLDGRTNNRQAEVDRFQEEQDLPFFLISLKAGGVGLNLTAADYVIHIDPWWNPAVEMQATDRTHRIGQDKPVFVYKMIVRDTVEEKVVQLQEKKKNLVDQLIATEEHFLKSLTTEDVKALFS
jgi:non-specific serine/threonine protein kinase